MHNIHSIYRVADFESPDSPHAVVDIIIVESNKESQNGQEDNDVACNHQSGCAPMNLNNKKRIVEMLVSVLPRISYHWHGYRGSG